MADSVVFEHSFHLLEILGALIITFFNVFTIWFKINLTPEQTDGKYDTEVESTDQSCDEDPLDLSKLNQAHLDNLKSYNYLPSEDDIEDDEELKSVMISARRGGEMSPEKAKN
jgi:hypothetical protein